MPDEVAALTELLGTAPPHSVAQLPPDVLGRLSAQIESGREHHRAVADDAVQKAINSVPLAVRGIVKRALT